MPDPGRVARDTPGYRPPGLSRRVGGPLHDVVATRDATALSTDATPARQDARHGTTGSRTAHATADATTDRARPTRRQVEVLRAYVRAGSVAAAAGELEISETTVRQHLSNLYRRTGTANAAQAAYLLGQADVREQRVAVTPDTRARAVVGSRPRRSGVTAAPDTHAASSG